jgi:hypothetical protein
VCACARERLFALFRVCLLRLLVFMCVFLLVGVILLWICVAVHVDIRRAWTWHTTRVNATQWSKVDHFNSVRLIVIVT